MTTLSSLAPTIGALGLILGSLAAQSNAIPGSDINVFAVDSPSYYGRVGSAYPNGTAGFAIGTRWRTAAPCTSRGRAPAVAS